MSADAWLMSLLGNCDKVPNLLELRSLLRELTETYGMGLIEEKDLDDAATRLCKSIQVLSAKCGNPVSHDKCFQTLKDKIVTDSMDYLARAVAESIRARKREVIRKKKKEEMSFL